MSSTEKIGIIGVVPIASQEALGSISNSSEGSAIPVHDREHSRSRAEDVERRKRKKLVRKLDTFLLPVLILMCLFQAVDKGLLGIAKVNGIERDLHLNPTQFNTAITIFQTGYLTLQLPSNLLITCIRPSIYLSLCCCLWSTVAACHSLVHNYHQLLLVRILLGVCDAPFFVGALHLLSSWYTRSELAKRTSILLGVMIITFTFIGPISAGIIGVLEGRNGWAGWRWLYLVFGCAGVGIAAIGAMFLPDYPEGRSAKVGFWRTEAEMEVARRRIREDRVGEKEVVKRKLWTGCKDAAKDVRVWIFVLMFMSRKSMEGLHYYDYAIIQSLHLFRSSPINPQTMALLLSSPPALLAALVALIGAYTSDRFSERTYHISVPLIIALIGLAINAATIDIIARYLSIYLWLAGSVAGTALAWSWVANSIQETPEKKAAGIAIVNVLGGLGAIWAPFLFRGQDAPIYRLAFEVLCGFVVIDVCCCLAMRWVLKRMNEKLRKEVVESGQAVENVNLYLL